MRDKRTNTKHGKMFIDITCFLGVNLWHSRGKYFDRMKTFKIYVIICHAIKDVGVFIAVKSVKILNSLTCDKMNLKQIFISYLCNLLCA